MMQQRSRWLTTFLTKSLDWLGDAGSWGEPVDKTWGLEGSVVVLGGGMLVAFFEGVEGVLFVFSFVLNNSRAGSKE